MEILIQRLATHGNATAGLVIVVPTGEGIVVKRKQDTKMKHPSAIVWEEVVRTVYDSMEGSIEGSTKYS